MESSVTVVSTTSQRSVSSIPSEFKDEANPSTRSVAVDIPRPSGSTRPRCFSRPVGLDSLAYGRRGSLSAWSLASSCRSVPPIRMSRRRNLSSVVGLYRLPGSSSCECDAASPSHCLTASALGASLCSSFTPRISCTSVSGRREIMVVN